ncbi:MAG: orotidine 5'-phosphate decarboxylase, partial [Defluviitaleaceae bacterium]|nr:orotidine 5'-phosphate decarboxylase [Defluviitaleaceae bacterium]
VVAAGPDLVIVGGGITGADDKVAAAKKFRELVK